jgi:hypothetical protein
MRHTAGTLTLLFAPTLTYPPPTQDYIGCIPPFFYSRVLSIVALATSLLVCCHVALRWVGLCSFVRCPCASCALLCRCPSRRAVPCSLLSFTCRCHGPPVVMRTYVLVLADFPICGHGHAEPSQTVSEVHVCCEWHGHWIPRESEWSL